MGAELPYFILVGDMREGKWKLKEGKKLYSVV